ncbi:HD domain-containing protein [Virgibacillus sp. JSM 102003]|uniref:HD domain-containing protein n=1 Tax=Virgibacillus sp. JSM 102003 TaxID=1562108 RepID=UPI0035C0552C
MNNTEKLDAIRLYIYNIFSNDTSGHDYYHMKRVAKMAKTIAEQEGANQFIAEAAAWIHDVGDRKLFANSSNEINKLNEFLLTINCTSDQLKQIKAAVRDVSFSKGRIPVTQEGKIVQDADRLDAIGAIGIARTFAYGGSKEQPIWDNNTKDNTSVQHFYDKLLTLKDLMHTSSAKEIAEERHNFMENYLNQFFQEW